jgi:hypothetical protein
LKSYLNRQDAKTAKEIKQFDKMSSIEHDSTQSSTMCARFVALDLTDDVKVLLRNAIAEGRNDPAIEVRFFEIPRSNRHTPGRIECVGKWHSGRFATGV